MGTVLVVLFGTPGLSHCQSVMLRIARIVISISSSRYEQGYTGVRYTYTYKTSFGEVTICSEETPGGVAIVALKFGRVTAMSDGCGNQTALTDRAAAQLEEYFAGERRVFELPLCPCGTVFQRAVWDALLAIPYGETRSYKQIAEAVGRPHAYRAVGMANNKNPIWIVIPCHRVIGTDGSLVGYGGGTEMKERLLRLEAKR